MTYLYKPTPTVLLVVSKKLTQMTSLLALEDAKRLRLNGTKLDRVLASSS